ncbi:Cdc37 Hsp90 binding domain protein [Cooperia oncophora]
MRLAQHVSKEWQKKKQKREEIEKNKSASNSKVEELEQKLKSADITAEEKEKIEKEIAEIKDQEAKWLAKEKELEEQERLEPWNVDTIGHEAFSYSRINKVGEKKPPPKLSDEEDSKRMTNFFDQNESLIQEYGKLKTLEESEEFILEHPHLASEYTANYLTIDALNLAIDNKASRSFLNYCPGIGFQNHELEFKNRVESYI